MVDPKSLNAEERAIWTQVAMGAWLGQPGCVNGVNFVDAFDAANRFIEAHRALFAAPKNEEPEPKVCPNCGKLTSEDHHKFTFCGLNRTVPLFSCTRPEPEPVDEIAAMADSAYNALTYGTAPPVAAGEIQRYEVVTVRPTRGDSYAQIQLAEEGRFVRYSDHIAAVRSQPAQRDERDAEMFHKGYDLGEVYRLSEQPALRMTPELERVLTQAESAIAPFKNHGLIPDIAAVRAQYGAQVTQGRKLVKVRELIQWMDAGCRPYKSAKESRVLRDAARAELDEWEGR